MKVLIIALLALAALVAAAMTSRTEDVTASSGGAAPVPLVGCPNLDADPNGYVRAGDISKTVQAFFKDAPRPAFPGDPNAFPYKIDGDYVFLYDRNADGILRAADISNVVQAFFTTCPLIDTQVAQATQWILQHPGLLTEANDSPDDLDNLNYIGGGQDVPGQGKHYININLWDGTFDPAAPEGLVYNNGFLAAQLYLVNGAFVGWLEDPQAATPGSCWDNVDNGGDTVKDSNDGDCNGQTLPTPPPLDDVDIDPLCHVNFDPCSWDTYEGWHLHYYLCFVHAGTNDANLVVIDPNAPGSEPPFNDECQELHDACPTCGGIAFYLGDRLGWMGHLWNWVPNANAVSDAGGMNGRFVDCSPDPEGYEDYWGFAGTFKGYECPQ